MPRPVQAVGLDLKMLHVRQVPSEVLPLVGNAQALPFPDRCFDAVVSNLGLPHFGRPEQAVAEVRRV